MAERDRYLLREEPVELVPGRPRVTIRVRNTGDRPVQVGSHYHFFEVNRALEFPREAAFGMRLDIPAGTAVRFEPGDEKEVTLVAFGGRRRAVGFSALTMGSACGEDARARALERARRRNFKGA